MKNINIFQLKYYLFIALIVLAPLSKYPSFSLPLFNFTSFRIGLYQLLAVIFIGLFFWNKNFSFFKKNKAVTLGILLMTFSLIVGGFFAIDKSRWLLLSSSVIILLLLLISAWGFVYSNYKKINWNLIFKLTLISAIVFSVLGIIQFIVNSFTSEDFGILCKNCTGAVFGFPRVNLFSAEPQFLANSLLPFLFIALFSFIKNKTKLALFALILTSIAIGLTFSRGAFLALFVGLITFWVFSLKNYKQMITGTLLVIFSVFIAVVMLVSSASIKYKSVENITYDTTSTVLQQLTLGVVSLPEKTEPTPPPNTIPNPSEPVTTNPSTEQFESPGLIEASSNERLEAAKLAIKAWAKSAQNLLIGTGLGNLGPFVVANINSSAPANLTVYIYYVLVLAEIGVIGLLGFLIILAGSLVVLFTKYKFNQPLFLPVIFSVITAFAVQYLFFGSYINVVYIWLWLGIASGLAALSQKQLSNLIK
jgi:hypothetical protein